MNGVSKQKEKTQVAATSGRLVDWNDAKGFGWVEAGGKRLFAHIKSFERGQRRPMTGDEVVFSPEVDHQGRPTAIGIRLTNVAVRIRLGAWLLLALLLFLPWVASLFLPGPDWLLSVVMAVMSFAAWFAYRSDKRKAAAGEWRTSELTLHLLGLLGGWPGAFLAQRKFRHKTRKHSFQFVFIGIMMFYQLAAVDVILRHAPSRWLVAQVMATLDVQAGG